MWQTRFGHISLFKGRQKLRPKLFYLKSSPLSILISRFFAVRPRVRSPEKFPAAAKGARRLQLFPDSRTRGRKAARPEFLMPFGPDWICHEGTRFMQFLPGMSFIGL